MTQSSPPCQTMVDGSDEGDDQQYNDETILSCVQCHKPATFMCSSCGLIGPRYCSPQCQKQDWKTTHYKTCKSISARLSQSIPSNTELITTTTTTMMDQHSTATTNPFQDQGTMIDSDIPMQDMNPQQQQQGENITNDTEEFADNLKFYMQQIYLIIKPVVVCIVLSIFWVKVGFNDQSDYSPTRPTYNVLSSNNAASSNSGGGSSNSGSVGLSSLANAAIIIGQIILVTIIIVFFFRKGWIKPLVVFFMLVVMLLLGFMTYLLILNLIQIFYIPLDYITLSMALWNFVVVGLVSIFWKGPLWLQQAYLTVLSSLMAFSLTGLEQWTTWILLGLLAVWDLIAVLCPFGPLRLLIESSRSQQREVPALLYSVNAVWFMLASPNHFHISHSFSSTDTSVDHPTVSDTKVSHYHQQSRATASLRSLGSLDNYQASTTSSIDPLHHQANLQSTQANLDTSSTVIHEDHPSHRDGFHRLQDNSQTTLNESSRTTDQPQRQQENDTDEEDVERSGLKLGLGDFVFYSVLIARAAMYDWITTVCCTIAVLTGLTATIFLLAIYKKALPALPISIAFGILFYFVAKAVLVPYIAAICVLGMVGI